MTQAKVALFSPFPPVRSGISDYSIELAAHLRPHLDISLVPDNYAPVLPNELRGVPILSPSAFSSANPLFLPVYQVGNSTYHEYMLRPMSVNPGIVVLHDTNLHGLFYYLTAARGRPDLYRSILVREYGRRGAAAADAVASGKEPPIYEMPLTGLCLKGALAVAVHSAKAQRDLQMRLPGVHVDRIPMGVQSDEAVDSRASRRRLGLPADAFIAGSFGHLIPKKRIHVALQAYLEFLRAFPASQYLLVGTGYNGYPEAHVEALGLTGNVVTTGFVPQDVFRDYIHAVDVCINLRHPDDGETSAVQIRAMAARKPVLYSDSGSGSDIPADAGIAIPVGNGEVEALSDALIRLASQPHLRERLGEQAHHHYMNCHRPETAALKYKALIARTLEGLTPTGCSGTNGGDTVENRHRLAGHSRDSRRPRNWDSRRPAH